MPPPFHITSPAPPAADLLTVEEAAVRLKVSATTVRKLYRQGDLVHLYVAVNRVRVTAASVAAREAQKATGIAPVRTVEPTARPTMLILFG